MESLQGHINQIPCGEHMSREYLQHEGAVDFHRYEDCMISNIHHQMPFLHMLLEEEDPQHTPPEPSSFQLLLRLQEARLHPHQQLQHQGPFPELKSCVTRSSESPSDALDHHQQQDAQPPASCGCTREPSGATAASTTPAATTEAASAAEKRRKRPRWSAENMEEVKSQRMTHIAVERNRRKVMNEHLSCLRSLMPPSFVQRGDQASMIGGAIDFVKELEQLLQSLRAEKQRRTLRSRSSGEATSTAVASPFRDFFISPQYATYTSRVPPSSPPLPPTSYPSAPCTLGVTKMEEEAPDGCYRGGGRATAAADVEATVVQTHVNLRVLTPRQPAQLLRAVAALEELHLSVLHLNITSLDEFVLYSLNLKIEEECKLSSADEIATAAHQIFSFINSTC